jgi:hypothetical protein
MKNILILILLLTLTPVLKAQVAVNESGAAPDASAMLDVSSTTQGFLAPRMTKSQREAIGSPATGLMVFQTDDATGFYYYDGSQWKRLTASDDYWTISGNQGLSSSTNFIGTEDNIPFRFIVNNDSAGMIDSINQNTFFGYQAGKNTTAGERNSAFGFNALHNVNSSDNTAFGAYALYLNTGGNENTAVGSSALEKNTYGSNNTAVGYEALLYNTYSCFNTAIGVKAMMNQSFTNGNSVYYGNNVAVGSFSLYNNEPSSADNGNKNTAVGNYSMYDNETGLGNTAVGYKALYSNDTSGKNVAFGYKALYNAKVGYNTAVGAYALYDDSTGKQNTAFGYSAGYDTVSLKTGNQNTLIGYKALVDSAHRGGCVAIAGEGNLSFGDDIQVRFGNSNMTSIGGQKAWTAVSDKRIKKNIKNNIPGLDFILKLKPVLYTYDLKKENDLMGVTEKSEMFKYYEEKNSNIVRIGFLAQQVWEAAQSVHYDFDGVDMPKSAKGLWGLRYALFTVPLVKAVQEQHQLIIENDCKIKELKKELAKTDELMKRLNELKQKWNNKKQ